MDGDSPKYGEHPHPHMINFHRKPLSDEPWAPPPKILQSSWMTMTTRIETYGDFGFLISRNIHVMMIQYDTMIMIIMNNNELKQTWWELDWRNYPQMAELLRLVNL